MTNCGGRFELLLDESWAHIIRVFDDFLLTVLTSAAYQLQGGISMRMITSVLFAAAVLEVFGAR
jgi:hypothetical protein